MFRYLNYYIKIQCIIKTQFFPSHLLIFNREELHYSKNGYMPNNRTCTVAHTSNLFILWGYASCILFLPQIYEHLIDQQILSSFLCISVHITTSIFIEETNVQYNSDFRNIKQVLRYRHEIIFLKDLSIFVHIKVVSNVCIF